MIRTRIQFPIDRGGCEGCGSPDSGTWVAGFRPGDAWFGSVFGCGKWRTTVGGSWALVVVAEGTGYPFLSPATGGGWR